MSLDCCTARLSAPGAFGDLDVSTTPLADGHTLVWNATSGKFLNQAGGGGGATTLADLTDTHPDVTSTAVVGHQLTLTAPGVWHSTPAIIAEESLLSNLVARSDAQIIVDSFPGAGVSNITLVGSNAGGVTPALGAETTVVGAIAAVAGAGTGATVIGASAGSGTVIPLGATVVGSGTLPNGGGDRIVAIGQGAGSLAGVVGPQPIDTICLGTNSTVSATAGLGLSVPAGAVVPTTPFNVLTSPHLVTTVNGTDYQIPLIARPAVGFVQLEGATVSLPIGPAVEHLHWSIQGRNDYGLAAFNGAVDDRNIIVPEAGIWHIQVDVQLDDNTPAATEVRTILVYLLSIPATVQSRSESAANNVTGTGQRLTMTGLVHFAASDTFRIGVGATDAPTLSASTTATRITMVRVGS